MKPQATSRLMRDTGRNRVRFLVVPVVLSIFTTSASHADLVPTGGSTSKPLEIGRDVEIRWTPIGVAAVDIRLYDAERRTTRVIAENVPAEARHYAWTIPADVPPGERYRFSIVASGSDVIRDISPSWVTISHSSAKDVVRNETEHGFSADIVYHDLHSRLDVESDVELRSIGVHTVDGRQVKSLDLPLQSRGASIDCSDLLGGVYIVTVHSAGGVRRTQLIVIRS
ncbi:MAG TPA: hypothetical protein DIS79_05470 [Bacteroidetes bacterium]|nr:hypothetical protein [Bacteroidota bacterium]HRK04750.1 Ser-Thr-rich GPI-anchored membrane family protein [Chlorobiota bacterium]